MKKKGSISYKFLNEVENWEKIVDLIWECSNQARFWNTKEMYRFRLICLKDKHETKDLSFLIYNEDQPVGFFFMLVFKDQGLWHGTFSGIPLYWPCISNEHIENYDLVNNVFSFINKICQDNQIDKINIMINASTIKFDSYTNLIREFYFIDESYDSHTINLQEFDIMNIRSKYRQMLNKYKNLFNVDCIMLDQINNEIIKNYYELHVLDSGGMHRSYETYVEQFKTLSKGGFIVRVSDNDIPVGMLMIYIGKNEAYEGSVAVNPKYANFYVSLFLKLKAIEYLKAIGIDLYELGQSWYYPTISYVPNAKKYGINIFKDGWSRGQTRKVYSAVKFYTEKALDGFLKDKKEDIMHSLIMLKHSFL